MAWVPAGYKKLTEVRDHLGLDKLGVCLAAGQLRAFELDGLGHMIPIAPELWRTARSKQIMAAGYTERPTRPGGSFPIKRIVLIKMPEGVLHGHTDTAPDQSQAISEQPEKRQGGRPSADWDSVFIAAACVVFAEGVPATQAAFISAVQTRLGEKAPGDTQMKERIGPLYRELKKEQGRSET